MAALPVAVSSGVACMAPSCQAAASHVGPIEQGHLKVGKQPGREVEEAIKMILDSLASRAHLVSRVQHLGLPVDMAQVEAAAHTV